MIIDNEYGHCHYCVCKDKECSMIYNLYIEEEHRRKGHAKELVQKAINKIRETGYKQDIMIKAKPEENSISREDLIKFYERMDLIVIDLDN